VSRALHVLEYNLLGYRRTWKGSLTVSFIGPFLFLSAMGLGLGSLVNRGAGLGGLSYLQFLAPALVMTACMQTAAIETTYPVMAKMRWNRQYEVMLSSPLGVRDILAGELAWLCLRLGIVSSAFLAVIALFGVPRSPAAALAVPVGILVGLAFGAPILAFSATQVVDTNFPIIFRLVITPLFLLAGTFFPITRLPAALQAVAWTTPIYHGVELGRGLVLDRLDPVLAAVHLGVLLLFAGAGVAAASITLRRRLLD